METVPSSPKRGNDPGSVFRAANLTFLREPSWIALTLLVVLLVPSFWHLSTWQFHRLDSRRTQNAAIAAATTSAPQPLEQVMAQAAQQQRPVPDWTPVWVDARWEAVNLMARKRWRDDVMGFWVVSPARTASGALLCVRGWVPTTKSAATTPTMTLPAGAGPQSSPVRLRGWLVAADPGAQAPGLPTGQVSRLNRTAWPSLRGSPLEGFVLVLDHARTEPRALGAAPGLYDVSPPKAGEGPHHSYAWQWRAFIVLVLAGWARLVFNEARQQAAARSAE